MHAILRYLFGPLLVVFLLGLGALTLVESGIDVGPVLGIVLVLLDTRLLLALAVGLFVAGFVIYLALLRREDPSRLVRDGPAVDALVPVYGDADVLHRSVDALRAAEYDALTITIITEPDDRPSTERAETVAGDHDRVRSIVNHDRPGSKAGALNTGIEHSEADVIALFDADQEPHPKLIPHAVAYLDGHEVVRVRSVPQPSGPLESMAYYEYLLLFFLPQKVVKALLGFDMAGTRSVLIDRAVFGAVGQFAEGHLAEDLDFTHDLHQSGLCIRELLYYPCLEQPAHTLRDWWGQRVRWMSGQVAVSHDHLVRWRDLRDPDVLGSLVTLVGTMIAGVLLAMTVPKLIVSIVAHPLAVGVGVTSMYAVMVATRLVDTRTAGLSGVGLAWLVIPVTLSLFGLVIVQVLLQYAFGRVGGWYRVEKSAEL